MSYSVLDTLTKSNLKHVARNSCMILRLKIDLLPLEPLLSQRKASVTLRDEYCMSNVKSKCCFLSGILPFAPVFFLSSPPEAIKLLIDFVSQLDSLPLTLRLSPLILTRLLTLKSVDPSSLASGNELVRWGVRFIAHKTLCGCVSEAACMCVRVCVLSEDFTFITSMHLYVHKSENKALNL